MQKILDLNPTQLNSSDILAQFDGLTNLSFPVDLGALPGFDSLPLPDLTELTDFGSKFGEIARRLEQGPEALAGELRQSLTGLADNLLEADGLLGSLTDGLGDVDTLTGFFGSGAGQDGFFQQIDSAISPALQLLQANGDNAAGLLDLFPLESLVGEPAGQFNQLLQQGLSELQGVDLQAGASIDWLDGYSAALVAVSDLQAGDQLEARHMAALNGIAPQVQDWAGQLETSLQRLRAFSDGQFDTLQDLPDKLDTLLSQLDPQVLGSGPAIFNQAIDTLTGPQFEAAVAKIDGVVQAIDQQAIQAFQQVAAAIRRVFDTINRGLETARQAMLQVSAVITDLLNQLKGFIQTAQETLVGLIEQLKQALGSFADSVNGVLDQINGIIGQVYDFAYQIVQQVTDLDFTPFIEAFHTMLFQITSILDHPEVRRVLDQARDGISLVAEQLDAVTLQPVFDQVISQSDQVKNTLASIDTTQLNEMLRQALKTALDQVIGAIDPPSKITDALKESYNSSIKPTTTEIIQAVQDQFNQIIEVIEQFEPGTLVSNLLTPHYEALLETVRSLIDPAQVLDHLAPLTEFYDSLLALVDDKVNPDRLLGTVMDGYHQILTFVDALSAEQLVAPLDDLLAQAKSYVDLEVVEGALNQVIEPVKMVQGFVANLDRQPIWNSIQEILNTPLKELISGLVQRLRDEIDRLPSEIAALRPVKEAFNAIQDFIQSGILPGALKQIDDDVQSLGEALLQKMSTLVDQWETAQTNLESLSLPNYADLKAGFQALNPVSLLAAPTNLIRQIQEMTRTVLAAVDALWQRLVDLINRAGQYLKPLAGGDFKPFLNQMLDGFMAGPLNKISEALRKPLAVIKRVEAALLHLKDEASEILQNIVAGLEEVRDGALGTVQEALNTLNLDFLREALQDVESLIKTPLKALEPVLQGFLDDLKAIYRRVMSTLQSINPIGIIASARGPVLLERDQAVGEIVVPVGTQLTATTPGGERLFRIIQPVTLAEGADSARVLAQAVTPGRSGEIVVGPEAGDQVTWGLIEIGEQTIIASHPEPILSLYTMAFDVIMKKLEALHPEKIIAEPLNEMFEQIRRLIDELGIKTLFDILFEKFDHVEQQLFEGLDCSAGALKGVIAAVPV